MDKEIDLVIKSGYEKEYIDGYPLISKESIVDISKIDEEGLVLNLFDSKKKFIIKAYHGNQNKGFGWALTQDKDEKIDVDFFKRKDKVCHGI